MAVRRAREGDLPPIARLYHDVWHETQAAFMPIEEARLRTLTFFLERMSALLSTTLVDEQDGVVTGFVAWRGRLLGQLYVDRPFRGSEVASRLIAEAERQMAGEGMEMAELHCVVGNERARRFYERMGWVHSGGIGERVEGANGPVDVDFWCMTKALIPDGSPLPT